MTWAPGDLVPGDHSARLDVEVLDRELVDVEAHRRQHHYRPPGFARWPTWPCPLLERGTCPVPSAARQGEGDDRPWALSRREGVGAV